jgi:hypothetical protein
VARWREFGEIGLTAVALAAVPCAAQTCEPYWTIPGARFHTGDLVTFDDGSGPAIYHAGYILSPTPPGNRRDKPVRRWRGQTWEPLTAGLPAEVYPSGNLRVLDDGGGPRLYFFGLDDPPIARFVRRWNGVQWEPANPLLYSQIGSGIPMISYDDGTGPAIYGVTGMNGNYAARWTGNAWTTIGEAAGNSLDAWRVFDDGTGPALYIMGTFLSVSGVQTRDIIRWDGQHWSAVGGGVVTTIGSGHDLCVYDGSLYVVDISTAGGQPINRIGRWDGTQWSGVGSGITSTGFMSPLWMCVFDDGTGPALFVTGLFEFAGGVPTRNIAKWDGHQWHAVPPGLGITANRMAVYDDGRGESLFIGGDFVSAGGGFANGLVQYVGCKTGNCYADCNRDGFLSLADFGCFQTKFADRDPYANCNLDLNPGSQTNGLSAADFSCFMTKFALGCP